MDTRKPRKLRSIREDKRMTQSKLAYDSGLSLSTIVRAERGKPPTRMNAKAIAEALGVTVESIAEFQHLQEEDSEEPDAAAYRRPGAAIFA